MQEDRIKCMEPKQDVTTQLNAYMDAWHAKVRASTAIHRRCRLTVRQTSIWAEECKSWYKDNQRNGRVYIWPGSLLHHLKFLLRPRYEHYELTYVDPDNIFAFLGNGRTICQMKLGAEAPVPYIRNDEDQAWDIE